MNSTRHFPYELGRTAWIHCTWPGSRGLDHGQLSGQSSQWLTMGVHFYSFGFPLLRRSACHLLSRCDECNFGQRKQHGSSLYNICPATRLLDPCRRRVRPSRKRRRIHLLRDFASTFIYSGTGTPGTQRCSGLSGDYIRVDGPRVWSEFVVQEGVVFNARAINSTASGAIKRQTMAETSCNT